MKWMLILALALGANAADPDYGRLLDGAKLSLSDAVEKGLKVAKEGVAAEAELEEEKGEVHFSIDIAQDDHNFGVVLDAGDGSIVEKGEEADDWSEVVAATKVDLAKAIEVAAKKADGQAVHAKLEMDGKNPRVRVEVWADGALTTVSIDGVTGKVVPVGDPKEEGDEGTEAKEADGPAYTETFGEDKADLGPTGTNPYFVLEPGYVMVLAGKEKSEKVEIRIMVLDETKKIDGVECRVVQEDESVDGEMEESTKDYFAISSRTNNVYYFGEDVDEYKDGKIAGHGGSWRSGKKGAHYGLMMPATPLLGARHYQEIAPGVGMDRAVIVSLTEKYSCAAGDFEDVLLVEESSPIEPGVKERKRYARGVGLLQDGACKLVKYGKEK